jgi:hypothetical protein
MMNPYNNYLGNKPFICPIIKADVSSLKKLALSSYGIVHKEKLVALISPFSVHIKESNCGTEKFYSRACLALSVARTGKEGFEVLTEFLRRNDTHHFIVKFFEIVNIADIPWRDGHSGAKPSIDP